MSSKRTQATPIEIPGPRKERSQRDDPHRQATPIEIPGGKRTAPGSKPQDAGLPKKGKPPPAATPIEIPDRASAAPTNPSEPRPKRK